jgi:hypothetical protein
LERDKHDALNTQKEAMNRTFRVQLAKMIRDKEELGRKLQAATEAAQGSSSSTSGELQKLAHENALLRGEKKKLEDQFQVSGRSAVMTSRPAHHHLAADESPVCRGPVFVLIPALEWPLNHRLLFLFLVPTR